MFAEQIHQAVRRPFAVVEAIVERAARLLWWGGDVEHRRHAAGFQDGRHRIGEVLQDVDHRDGVKAVAPKRQGARIPEQHRDSVAPRQSHTLRLVVNADSAYQERNQAVSGADIQHAGFGNPLSNPVSVASVFVSEAGVLPPVVVPELGVLGELHENQRGAITES